MRRARGGRAGRGRGGMDVWELANALLDSKKAVPTLPEELSGGEEDAKKFLGRMCLLCVNDAPSPLRFAKRYGTHICICHIFVFATYLYLY